MSHLSPRQAAVIAIASGLLFVGATRSPVPAIALHVITPEAVLKHVGVLASDEFEGRGPGTPAEEKTVDYLLNAVKAMKLEPGNPDGTYIQKVALWGVTPESAEVTIKTGDTAFPLAAADYTVASMQPAPTVAIPESQIVFVGYGMVAPEWHWDDYKNVDVKGKVVVILGGDPPLPDPNDPSRLDPKMFLGSEPSFYSRAGIKADIAQQHGAAAVITLRNEPRNRFTPARAAAAPANRGPRESMMVRDADSTNRIAASVTLAYEKAVALFAASGQDLNALRESAVSPEFKPVALKATISADIHHRVREFESKNVVGKLEGSDPALRNEYVIYSAHWDHLGRQGDNIFHGASDNAAGTAGVLELAHAFSELPKHPKRTVVFLWVTAEERGLLGAEYYVEHPLYPLAKTVADINLDYFSNWGWGRTKDFSILGIGNSSMDDLVKQAVARQGRVVTGDTDPTQGFYWRSDHVEFAMAGVPVLEMSPGIDYVGKPAGWGEQKRQEYISKDYHKPTDQVKPDWDLTGAVEDLDVLLEVGYRVAQEPGRPVQTHRPPYLPNSYSGN